MHNGVRRAHGSGLVLIAFLPIAKSMFLVFLSILCISTNDISSSANKEHTKCPEFCQFRHRIFHASLTLILDSLHPGKTTPEVCQCPDGQFWWVIWGIGPYIADYPEQALLACIVQGYCAKWVISFLRCASSQLWVFVARCQAFKDDLDGDLSQLARTQEFTEGLMDRLPLKMLWEDYGIVSAVMVCPMHSFSPLCPPN
jgi:hypothetical protein